MTSADREKWDRKYAQQPAAEVPPADEWLMECVADLAPSRALDLACGLGQNAIALARQGWEVDAVDISSQGLQLAAQQAERNSVSVNWIRADLDEWSPLECDYDLICVFRFLDWSTVPPIVAAGLKPGGTLCYETFAASQLKRSDNHLKNPAHTVERGDWERYFPGFHTVSNETICLSNRDIARFHAIRRSSHSAR